MGERVFQQPASDAETRRLVREDLVYGHKTSGEKWCKEKGGGAALGSLTI